MESEGYKELKEGIGIGYVRHGVRKRKIPNVDGAFDSSKSEERALPLVKLGRNVIKEKIGKQTAGTARKRKIAKERRRKRQKKY